MFQVSGSGSGQGQGQGQVKVKVKVNFLHFGFRLDCNNKCINLRLNWTILNIMLHFNLILAIGELVVSVRTLPPFLKRNLNHLNLIINFITG